jgi:hypothetical protein
VRIADHDAVARFLPPDTRERNRLVSLLAGPAETLLDVGGESGVLQAYLPEARVTTVNLEPPADLVVSGVALPFEDAMFDVAVSVDVLEHLSAADREPHLRELQRVAGKRVVACCPLGGARHEAAERELADWYARKTGARHRFLDEHLLNGLPREAELRELAARLPWQGELLFQGDFRRAQRIFRLTSRLRRRRDPFAALQLATLLGRAPEPLRTSATPWTNRAFLVADAPVPSQRTVLA